MTEQDLTALAVSIADPLRRPILDSRDEQMLAQGYLTLKAERDDLRARMEMRESVAATILSLRAERDALQVQLEQSKQALKEFVEWHGGAHSDDCPKDDTCDCIGRAINAKVNAVLRDGEP